jgi:hypothetical protein
MIKLTDIRSTQTEHTFHGNLPQEGISSGDQASDRDLRSDRVWEAAVWSATGLGLTFWNCWTLGAATTGATLVVRVDLLYYAPVLQ